jgi:hypothetical protein
MEACAILSVVDILNGERFRFPVADDCYFKVKHLKYEMSLLSRRNSDHRLLIIRDGEILDDEDYLVPHDFARALKANEVSRMLEFYLMAQPKQVESKEKPACVLDEGSLQSAKDWMSTHGSYTSEGEVQKRQYILSSLEKLTAPPAADDQQSDQAPDAVGVGGAAVRREGEIQWINMRIMTRLGVAFLLFFNGTSASRIRVFCAVSAVYYVIETGIVVYLLKKFVGDLYVPPTPPPPAGAPAAPAAAAGAAAAGAAAGAAGNPAVRGLAAAPPPAVPAVGPAAGTGPPVRAPQPPAPDNLWIAQRLARQLLEVFRSGAAIPPGREGGLGADAVSFLTSIVLSLVPEWSPHGHAGGL